jgi:hypothetical protein
MILRKKSVFTIKLYTFITFLASLAYNRLVFHPLTIAFQTQLGPGCIEWASFSLREFGMLTHSFLMALMRWGRDEMLHFFFRLDFIIPDRFSTRFRSEELPS